MLDICESSSERNFLGRGSRCWLGMTLDVGTTLGFSTKGPKSGCCLQHLQLQLSCCAQPRAVPQQVIESPRRRPPQRAMKVLVPLQPQRQWLPLGHSRRLQRFHPSSFHCPAPGQRAAAPAFILNPAGLWGSGAQKAHISPSLGLLSAFNSNTVRCSNCWLISEP